MRIPDDHIDSTQFVDGDNFTLTNNVIDTKAMSEDPNYKKKGQIRLKGKLTTVFKIKES